MHRKGVLMDRDGTICEEVGYVDRVDQIRLLRNSAEAIRKVNEAGLQAVVVTNQAGVAHGHFDESLIADAHERLRALLAEQGARLDGIYYCPHHPEIGDARYRRDCDCRKPGPGMLWRARDEMGIDLSGSYMVGDRFNDLQAGATAGATPILVLTGFGRDEVEYHAGRPELQPAYKARDLLAAVDWILEREDRTQHDRAQGAAR
jgi:D-glycero-D-manno-heptose 1,7-bisphosphate phosphatase